jgi:hypothetical protein
MSRTIRGAKPPGYEWNGRRPYSWWGPLRRSNRWAKRAVAKVERAAARAETRRERR